MSYLKTKKALIQRLLSTAIAGVTEENIIFENKFKNPAGFNLWLSVNFIPSTSEATGKDNNSSNEQRGVFQVSVFVNLNSPDYDYTQLQAVDEILSGFTYSSKESYEGVTVEILDSDVNSGLENESWFKRDISIRYITFTERA